MDLVNIIYRYVNRFINSNELINLLINIDKKKFSKNENEKIEKLLEDVKKIIENVPIEMDQIEIKRLASLNRILENLEKIKSNKENNEEVKKVVEKQYDNLLKQRDELRDSGPRYEKLYDLLVNNSVYITHCNKMDALELLEFITQYISAPMPPDIDQETFDELVYAGIKEDKRESLWRLAFNYNGKNKCFTHIENYFIEKRDAYYLTELISAVKEDLNMNELTDKVIGTKDKNFIIDCSNKAKDIGILTNSEIKEIKEKMTKDVYLESIN